MIARARTLAAVGVFATLALTAVAVASHWPAAGGGMGHPGYQPVDPVGPPIGFEYTVPDSDDGIIRTSILTTGGDPRAAYASTDGVMHHTRLADGEQFSAPFILNPDFAPDSDVLGYSGSDGIVSPVDTSSHDDLGYTIQVFNEDAADTAPTAGDIVLSIFRQEDGLLVSTKRLNGTAGYSIDSSPVLFEGALYFVGWNDGFPLNPDPMAENGLFKVNIENLGGSGSPVADADTEFVAADSLTTNASPTAMWLKTAPDGTPAPFVGVGTGDGEVLTFNAETLEEGPASASLGGTAYTPSVPVLPDGDLPAPGQSVETAPYIYVAVESTEPVSDQDGAQVIKLTQDPTTFALVKAPDESNTSNPVLGLPSTMLAVSQLADEPATTGGAYVVLNTECDVFSINVADMSDIEPMLFDAAPAGCAGAAPEAGFSRTTSALSGNTGFTQSNNGDQYAFSIDSMDQLSGDQFEETSREDDASESAYGNPAISRRYVQFGDDKRLTVYSAQEALAPGETGAGFAVNDVTIAEGNSGERAATFTITRTGSETGSVRVATADNSAKAGEDYTAVGETLVTFGADERSKTIDVPIKGDTTGEADETFFVKLSRPRGSGAHIVDGEGLGLITNDDGSAAGIGITDITATEGTPATFNVTLSSPQTKAVTVNYVTADGTAKAGSDYTAISGKLVFNPGETSKPVAVAVLKDSRAESPERFDVKLSGATGSPIVDDTGTALISDVVRRKPRRFTANVRPRRDTAKPFRFVTTGRLTLPTGMSKAVGCKGRVQVQVKAGRKTISARRTRMRSTCRYRGRVTFKNAKRFNSSGRLKFVARFLGNAELTRSKSVTRYVRTK